MFADWFIAWMGIHWQQLPSQAKKSSPRHSETGKCWLWMSVKVPSRVPNQTATLLQWQEKPHTHKLQVVIDQPSQEMICTAYTHGRKHDFQVFPHSQAPPLPHPCIAPRTGLARTSSTTSPWLHTQKTNALVEA